MVIVTIASVWSVSKALVCIVVIYFSSSLAMTKPDRQLIAQVMLYSQGFRTAEVLVQDIFQVRFQAPTNTQ